MFNDWLAPLQEKFVKNFTLSRKALDLNDSAKDILRAHNEESNSQRSSHPSCLWRKFDAQNALS
jgi:hypothetical protein